MRLLRWLFDLLRWYEGPAKVETIQGRALYGWAKCEEHWVKLLTVDGEATQYVRDAVIRVTPLSWNELTRAAADAREKRRAN